MPSVPVRTILYGTIERDRHVLLLQRLYISVLVLTCDAMHIGEYYQLEARTVDTNGCERMIGSLMTRIQNERVVHWELDD